MQARIKPLISIVNKNINPLAVRQFNSAPILRMPIHQNGQRYWSDQEMMERYRQGIEDAGGKIGTTRKYTEDDIKAAFDAGSMEADKFLGGAARGAYEEGMEAGKLVGRNLEQQNTADRIKTIREEAERVGYRKGLEGNPNVKTELAASYQKGVAEGEKLAQQKLDQVSYARGYKDGRSVMADNKETETNTTQKKLGWLDFFITIFPGALQTAIKPESSSLLSGYGQQHGEMWFQKKINSLIEEKFVLIKDKDPAKFGLNEFTTAELESIDKAIIKHNKAVEYREEMRIEMKARRASGHSDKKFFGERKLDLFGDNRLFSRYQDWTGSYYDSNLPPTIENYKSMNDYYKSRPENMNTSHSPLLNELTKIVENIENRKAQQEAIAKQYDYEQHTKKFTEELAKERAARDSAARN